MKVRGRRILVTGAAGFIGSNLTRLLSRLHPKDEIIGFDKLGYASNPDFAQVNTMERGDLCNKSSISRLFLKYKKFDVIYHLAAESHVCNSISDPEAFLQNNIVGTFNLLQAIREFGQESTRLVSVSTDEVFGELEMDDPAFSTSTPYAPRSPYAASKAAADHLVKAFVHTYGLNAVITNCSNNYGPNQHEEKLIPKTIYAILQGESVEVFGTGKNVRDWIHVEDHCRGLIAAAEKGIAGESYLFGGNNEKQNLEVISSIHAAFPKEYKRKLKVKYVNERPTDDKRYAIDNTKASSELGWKPEVNFLDGLSETIQYYIYVCDI